jgi:ubiquinone/menaquinone biosynthesis C-methylase UbiE
VTSTGHRDRIIDQFTRQATPFNTAATITGENALKLLVAASRPGLADKVLDVACGGGIVVCAFAPHVAQATGIDLTPAMLDHARNLATKERLSNVSWHQGDITALPYPDSAFSIVVTRFSFHHLINPVATLKEMVRVCSPGGRIIVADMYASENASKAAQWNRLERLRDPSHVRCLALAELQQLFAQVGLPPPKVEFYELTDSVDALLSRSFPDPGDGDKIKQMFGKAVVDDSLGVAVERDGDELRYHYPVAILSTVRRV